MIGSLCWPVLPISACDFHGMETHRSERQGIFMGVWVHGIAMDEWLELRHPSQQGVVGLLAHMPGPMLTRCKCRRGQVLGCRGRGGGEGGSTCAARCELSHLELYLRDVGRPCLLVRTLAVPAGLLRCQLDCSGLLPFTCCPVAC